MFRTSSSLMVCLTIVAALTSSGCGGGGKPKTYPVKTVVLVNGAPATGASITLHPEAGEWKTQFRNRPAGKVADDGTVKFSTFSPQDGVPAGEYVVTIHWPAGGDRDALHGEHQSPERPNPLKLTVAAGSNDLTPIQITSAKLTRKK
ncbi:hypothetical protein [Zavarzinella formosa]|uniref:hypothetical protein n=1 Tax=Zavarzinella formosa TaxID=360055 RepID=UPI000381B2D0|nr:hypothetical protein [Zavarzinella formosa]